MFSDAPKSVNKCRVAYINPATPDSSEVLCSGQCEDLCGKTDPVPTSCTGDGNEHSFCHLRSSPALCTKSATALHVQLGPAHVVQASTAPLDPLQFSAV